MRAAWERGSVGAVGLCIALAACSKAGPDRIEQVAQAADSADQLMIGMSTNLTAEGVRTGHLEADSAFVYESSGHTDLKNIKVTFYTPSGVQTSVLTALAGWYRMRSGEMEARGNVVLVRTDGARLTTSVLTYDQSKNQVRTDQPYVYTVGEKHAAGSGFECDPSFTVCKSNSVRGSAGPVSLPGQ
jgi:LPS export ABC transporter protein LptC